MQSADYAVARCLSVCPSHSGILSKLLYISTFKFILHWVTPPATILVFFTPNGMAIFQRVPLNEAVECMEGMKNHDFRPISRFISEMTEP